MDYTASMLGLAAGLFLGMLALLELGRRLGQRRLERDPQGASSGVSVADGAVFALLGLLIAFTFSGAAARFQARREFITDESNAIGTAWLRLDLLPAAAQPAARENMRRYVDARLAVYAAIPDQGRVRESLDVVSARQTELWRVAVDARGSAEPGWQVVVFPALNEMFDIGARRAHAMGWHPPAVVFALLFALALGCALLAGFAMAGASRRPSLHMLAFAAVVATTIYVICDLELPRYGFLRVDGDDQVLIDVRTGMR